MMNVKINEGWLHNWVELHARVLTQRTISCAIIHNCHPIARLEVKLFFTVSHEILLGGQKVDMILNIAATDVKTCQIIDKHVMVLGGIRIVLCQQRAIVCRVLSVFDRF